MIFPTYYCNPWFVWTVSPKTDSFVGGRAVDGISISPILCMGSRAEITSSIVEPIPITVVYLGDTWEQQTMHSQGRFDTAMVTNSRCCIPTVPTGDCVPVVPRNEMVINSIHKGYVRILQWDLDCI